MGGAFFYWTTDKVRANERNASSLAISQRVQPKFYGEVINRQRIGER